MNTRILAAALALAFVAAAPANAADDRDGSPAQRFQGVSVGAAISWDNNRTRNAPVAGQSVSASRGGVGYRAFAGYDVALGDRLVIGAEAGLGGGGRTATDTVPGGRVEIDPGFTYDLSARAGVAATEQLLLYGRVGYRWQQVERSAIGATTVSQRRTDGGIAFGGGAEIKLTDHVALRAEYQHTHFDSQYKQDKFLIGAAFRF